MKRADKMSEKRIINVKASCYMQYGTDNRLMYPSDGIGGWHTAKLPLNLDKTAIVVMHAGYVGEESDCPEKFRRVEYLKRSYEIAERVYPQLLYAVRKAGMKVYHVPYGEGYFETLPGYRRAEQLAEKETVPRDMAENDEVLNSLYEFRADWAHGYGDGSSACIAKSIAESKEICTFISQAAPQGDEGIAAGARQLAALAAADGVNHLIYIGFAIDGCLLTADGGMMDMLRRRFMCSTVEDAVTAIECRESGREQLHLQTGLWRVGSSFGFVYQSSDIIDALKKLMEE